MSNISISRSNVISTKLGLQLSYHFNTRINIVVLPLFQKNNIWKTNYYGNFSEIHRVIELDILKLTPTKDVNFF